MYLHLGQNTVIRSETIVGIFDLEKTTVSKITREYLAQATAAQEVVTVSYELPKSFIVTEENEKRTVYISQISPSTLLRRTGFIQSIRLSAGNSER